MRFASPAVLSLMLWSAGLALGGPRPGSEAQGSWDGSADTLSLDADQAVELALANNRAIQLAREQVVEAEAGRRVAFGSFLPQVSVSGTYTRLANVSEFTLGSPVMGKFPIPVRDLQGNIIGFTDSIPMISGYRFDTLQLGNANNYVLRGTVQQAVFTWGKLLNAYKLAGLALDVQQQALARARAQVQVDAVAGFYQALLTREMAALMAESYAQLQRHVNQVQALYDNGLATKLDLMRSQVGLTNMAAQVSQLQSGAELALAALRTTIGVPAATPLVLQGELAPETSSVDLAAATDSALSNRPELAQLRTAVRMAELGVRIARTANLPTAFAALNYDYKRPVGFDDNWGSDWNATVGLTMPLFTGGANLNKVKQAESKHRQAAVGLALAEEGIRLEVQAQVAALNQEARNIGYQSQNVAVADAALKLAETRYESGLLTNLEYLDTQLALTQSRVAYLTALANYQVARARLRKAIGEN
jgi:outer membrane protein TolC